MIDVGTSTALTVIVTDSNGDRVSCTTMQLTLTLPDGTTAGPFTVAPSDTGKYSYNYTFTQAGRYVIRWLGATPSFTWTDVENVWPADPKFLFSLDEAKATLRRTWSTDTADDEDLRLYIAATTAVIEDIVGPVASGSYTYMADGGLTSVVLPHSNVTVTGVTVNGNTWTDFTVNTLAGIVFPGNGMSWQRLFPRGHQNITITYTAGLTTVPANVLLAAREEFRFLWQIGQQGNRPGFGDPADSTEFTPSGFAVPRRVIELCAANQSLPAIA